MTKPVKVVLDSMLYDRLAGDADLRCATKALHDRGLLEILRPVPIEDELDAIPQERDIGQKSSVPTSRVGTPLFLLDKSLLGIDCLGDDETHELYANLLTGSGRNVNDSLIGTTAAFGADIIVTDDGRFAKRLKALNPECRVLDSADFKTFISEFSPPD